MDAQSIRTALSRAADTRQRGAAVLIPLVEADGKLHVLLELRSLTLDIQPGEVCLPGGHMEVGERPRDAAIRETCEELCIAADQIELLGALGAQTGPRGIPLHVFVGTLRDYRGSFSPTEVDHTFTVPLGWLLAHDPQWYEVELRPHYPDDYPWELVPGGSSYRWRTQVNRVPFYEGTDPVIWGATARVLDRFARLCREAIARDSAQTDAMRPSDA